MKIFFILLLLYLEDAQLNKSHRKNHFVGKLTNNHQDSKNLRLNIHTPKNGVKKYSILKKNGKTLYNIPKNQIFSPQINEHWMDIGGLKRDMLVFPAQTLVSLYQKPVSDFAGDHRISSAVFFDDPLMKSSQAPYHFLNSAKSSFPTYNSQQYLANQDPDLINQMEINNNNRMLYDDPIPAEYKDMQGLQDSEEMLVGKIVSNAPKGTTLTKTNSQIYPSFHPSTQIAPSYNENNNYLHSSFNNGLIEKILAPQYNSQFGLKQQEEEFKRPTKQFKHDMQDNMLLKPQKEINCDPVQLSEVANCTNSIDPLCKDDDLSSFRANGLHQHQTYRRVHQTPPLELNNMLNNEAQNYSEVLANAPKLSYSDPRDRPGQGENIAVRCSDDGSILSAKEAVSYWYNKACKDEKYAAHFSPEITQFAQLVWKNTNFMGMGRATKKKGDLLCTYIVARYSPQATKDGFAENVPQFDSRKICVNRCIKDADHVSVSFNSNEQSSKNGPEEKEKFLNHEAIFNKMKDITEEDRQRLQTRSEEEANKEDKSEEHLNYFDHVVKSANNIQLEHAPIGDVNQDYSSFSSEYGKLTPEKLTESSKVPEINPEVRQSSKSAEYPLVIHSSATKRNSAKSTDKILATRSKEEEEDLDLEDDAASYKKPGNSESVLDLSSPKPHKHKGPLLSNLSHSSLINGDDSELTHPENVNTHHQSPLKERVHEMESEREDQEKDESDVEHDKYVEKMHRHYERIKAKSDEQKIRDRNRGAAFMERFLSSDVDGGSPSFEATASLWREPSKKKKRKRRKKKYDDEDDDNDADVVPEKDNTNNDDTAGKDEDATSRVFGKKVKNLADSEISDEYDASGKLIAKSVDSERPKTSHFKSIEYKNEQRTRPKEEGTLVNPHAPDQLSSDTEFNPKATNTEVSNMKGSSSKQDNSSNTAGTHGKMMLLNQINRESPVNYLDKQEHISSKDSSNTILSSSIDHNVKSEKLLKENTNKDTSLKLEPQTSLNDNSIKNIFKTEKLQTELKPLPLISAGAINSTTAVNNISLSLSSGTQPKTTNVVYHGPEKTRPMILEKFPINSTERTEHIKHLKMNSNDKIGKSSDQSIMISDKTAKTDSSKIISLSKKVEKLGVVDPPKKALHDEISNYENFDTEPKFEKGSDAEIQYKINKKVSKVQSLNNDKEESEENSPNKLKTDFVKVKNEMKLQTKKNKKKEDLKTIAHFEDIGEENNNPKNNENAESNLIQSDSSLVLAEKTLNEINNTIVKNDIEAKAASVLRESSVMPVAFIHPATAVEAKIVNSAPQVVHKSLAEKPDIMVFINNTQNNTLQRSFTHTGPGRESEEEDLPVFQEVTDTRIPNNEEADIHELSRTAGMRPTRPVKRTVPGLRISKLTNDGLVDLMFLEKASPKTSDPATRHVLQTFFDSVGLKLTNAEPSSSYIQLIPTKDLDEFRKEMVEQHNKFRSIHQVKPLHLDKSLSKDAQSYAAYVAKHNSVAHSDPKDRPDIGESVAEMCTKEGVLPTAEHIVSKWYSEICNPGFDFKNVSKQPGTGHFTQIIWKDTYKLGVGLAVANHPNGDSCSYVVARYKSAGNYLDKIRENVLEGYFSREKCNSLESNVFSRNILARASHQSPISGSVRTMKGSKHSIKVKFNKKKLDEKQNVSENFIAQALFIPMRYQQSTELKQLILPSLQTNQLPAPPPQKLTISGLSNKNIEIDFEVREDVDEEPQSKSKILRHSRNDTVSDLDRKSVLSSVLQNNTQISADRNYKRTIVQRGFKEEPKYNDHEYSSRKLYFNEEKREKRSNEKNKSLEVAKKQEFIFPGFGNEDGSSASTPVHSFIINNQGGIFPIQTQNAQNIALQSTLKKEAETSQPYQNVAQTLFTQQPVQQTANLVTKPLFVSPDVPLSHSINYQDSLKLENYNGHLDNSHLQSQLVRTSEGVSYNSPLNNNVVLDQPAVLGMPVIDQQVLPALHEYKTFNGEVNQTFMDSSSDLVRQRLLLPKSNETSEEDLGVPLCMLPAKGTKEALEITSKIFGNRTLPPAIMKKCNSTVLLHLKLFNNIKNQSPTNINGAKKFIVPKSRISFRLENSHLNKKDAENEINKYFKSRHSNQTKHSNRAKHRKPFASTSSKISKKVKLNEANKFNFTTKNIRKNSTKNDLNAFIVKDAQKPARNLSIKKEKNNDNSDLENYLSNIVVKLHDLDTDKIQNVDSYQSKKSNVKTQSQLEKKTDSSFSNLSHKNANSKMLSIKPEKYVVDSGHKRLLQIQDNVDSKQYVSSYSPMSHEIGMEQIHENNHIDEVNVNSNSASYSTTELEVNDKPFSTNNQEALVSDHDTESYSLSSNNGQEQEVFTNGFNTNSNQHEISAIDNVKSNDVSETNTDSIQDPDHSQLSSSKEIDNLKANVDSNESVQSVTEDDPALSAKYKDAEKTGNEPNITPLQTYSKELEKEVQRIPTEEIKDSNREANAVANHIATSFNWEDLQAPLTSSSKSVKNGVFNVHDTAQDSTIESLHDHLYDNTLVLDRDQRNVRSGKTKIENRMLNQALNVDAKESKFQNFEEQKPGKFLSSKENSKAYKFLRHFKNYQLKKLKDVHEKQLLKAELNKKIEEKELKKFSEDFLKEAKKLIKESKDKKKPKFRKFNDKSFLKTNHKEMESDSTFMDKDQLKLVPSNNSSKKESEKDFPEEKEVGSFENRLKLMPDHANLLLDADISLRPQNPSIVEQSALMAINQFRAIHLAPRLQLSEKLSQDAQMYADELVQRHGGVLISSPILTRLDQGENLAIDCDPHDKLMSGSEAVVKWYKELCEKGYNFNEEPTADQALGTLHFTQMVWQSTKFFGVGIVTTKKNKMTCTIVVARFHPPGNIPRRFRKNVVEGLFDGKICASIKKIDDDGDSLLEHTSSSSSQVQSDQYVNHFHQHKPKKIKSSQEDEEIKHDSNKDKEKLFVFAAEKLSAANKTNNDSSENIDQEYYNEKSSLNEDEKTNMESQLERAKQSHLAQKVLQQIIENDEQKKVSKYYYTEPISHKVTRKYKLKVITGDQPPNEDNDLGATSSNNYDSKEFLSLRGLIGKSNISLEALEAPSHLKGSPLDELDDEPKLKFVRGNEKMDDNEDTIIPSNRALKREDFSLKNISGDSDASVLLWNRDEGGHTHPSQTFIRRNARTKNLNQSIKLPFDNEAWDESKKNNKMIYDENDQLEHEKLGFNEVSSNIQSLSKNSTHSDEFKGEDQSALLNKYLSSNKLKLDNFKAIRLGDHLILHTIANSSLIENLNSKKPSSSKEFDQFNLSREKPLSTGNKQLKESFEKEGEIENPINEEGKPTEKKLDVLTEQNESEKKPEDLVYESAPKQKGRKKLNHLDLAHYEHAQNKKPGNNPEEIDQPKAEENDNLEGSKSSSESSNTEPEDQEQQVKKPPPRKPPPGLKGHGEEEQADDNKLVAGNEMLNNEESKKPSKRPTFGLEPYKPIASASPTPLVISSPRPMISSLDINAKLVQTLGPWPSISFSSFGSPVVLHIGATGFYEDDLAFLRIGLSTHNKLRKIHGSPPMEMDQELTAKAYRHAVSLTNLGYLKHESLRQNPTLELIPGVFSTMGENLFLGCYDGEYDISAEEAVIRWYGEVCSPGHCFNKTSQCSGTGHFSQVVWASSVRLGMAKATRMQNGLRCTYIVAKYFPEGNNHMFYNENVLKGNFNEKETCHDVIEALVTFETRNIDKANMVAQEKNLARLEFLKSLKDAEKQVTENINKELTTSNLKLHNSSGCCGLIVNNLDKMKQSLPVNAGGSANGINHVHKISQDRLDLEEFKGTSNQITQSIPSSRKVELMSLKKIRNGSLLDLIKDQKYKMLNSTVLAAPVANSEEYKNPIKAAKSSYENSFLTARDPNLVLNNISQNTDDELEANGITKSVNGLNRDGNFVPDSYSSPPEIDDLDLTAIRNKLDSEKQAKEPLDHGKKLFLKQSENESKSDKIKQSQNNADIEMLLQDRKKVKKLPKVNTRVEGGPNDPNSRVDEEKLNLRPPSQRKHTRLESSNFPTIRKTQKHVSKQKPMVATDSVEDSGDLELSGDDKPKKEDFQDKFKKLSTQKLPEVNINVPGGPNDPAAKLEDMDNKKGSDASEELKSNSKPLKSGNNAKDVYKNRKSNEKKPTSVLNFKDQLQSSLKMANLENDSQIDSLTQDLAGDMHHEFESSTDVTSGIILHRLKNPRESYHLMANGIKSENVLQRPLKSVYLQSKLESETHDSTSNLKLNGEENSLNQRKPDFVNDINIANINHQSEEDRFNLDSDDLSSSPAISVKVECKISSENPDQAAPYLLSTKCGSENEKAFHGAISGDVSLFQLSALNAHNAYRHAHNAPSLVLNERMSKEAAEYAKEIAEAASLRHSNTEDGENIATVCRSKDELMTGQEASTIWYREVCDPGYDFSSALPGKAGHFTQVVWKNSRQFGIGRASKFHNGLLCTYVVARYRPAGNFIGEFAANVLQGHFRSPRECLNLARKRSGIGFPRSNTKENNRSKRSKVLKPKISLPASLSSYSIMPMSIRDHKQFKKLPYTSQNGTVLKVERFELKNYKANKTKSKIKKTVAPFEQVSHFHSKQFSSENPFNVHYGLSSNKRGEISSKDDFVLFSVKSKEESTEPLSQIQLEYIPDQTLNQQLPNVESNDYSSLISEDYIVPSIKKEKSAFKDTKNVSYEENDVYNREKTHSSILQNSKIDAKNEFQNENHLLDMFLNPYKGKNVQFSTKLTEREKALRNRLLKKKSSYEVSAGSRSPLNEKKETGSGTRRQTFAVSPKVLSLTPNSDDVKIVPSYVAILLPTSISANEVSGMSKKSENKLEDTQIESSLQTALDGGSSSDSEVSEFELSTLSLHNLYRSLHESPPLTLDKKLTSEAKERAEFIAGKGIFPKYEPPALADENIAEVCKGADVGELLTGTDATMLWYDTVCSPSYIFGVDWVQEKATPFTQVVWKDTTRLGVARSTFYRDNKKCSVVVAKYFPSKNKTAVVSNVVRGDYDAKSYCDGLGAVYASSPEEEQSNNLVKTVLPKRLVTQDIQDFRQEALNLHNKFRAVHGAPAIKLDEDLCIEAEMYASKLSTEGTLRRSNSNDGENFAKSCSQNRIPMTGDEVVRKWYNEICSPGYSFAQDSPKSGTESFSQMVWKETSKMGIGKAISEEDGLFCTYVVSRYYRRGNIPVQFKENVVKGQFDFGYCESLGKSRQKVKRRDKFDSWKRTMDNNAMRRRQHFKRSHRRYREMKYPDRKVFFTKDKQGKPENLMKHNITDS